MSYRNATVHGRPRQLAVALAGFQVLDVIGNAIPRQFVKQHLDHLGVPEYLRPMLPVIKLSSSAGLVVGLRLPRLGALTSAALIAYYVAAARFHVLSGDHPVLAAPAAGLCGVAAVLLFDVYLPAIERT
jgi:hypothetical protein